MYLKKISKAFHNGSNYDDHFMVKELAEEFEKQFTCLREKKQKKKKKAYTLPIKNQIRKKKKTKKKKKKKKKKKTPLQSQ